MNNNENRDLFLIKNLYICCVLNMFLFYFLYVKLNILNREGYV